MVTARPAGREGNKFTYTLVRPGGAPSGSHNVRFAVETTDTVNPKLEFNVFVPVFSNLRVAPSPLIFPTAKVGQAAVLRGKLLGWSTEGSPRFELNHGGVKVLSPESDGIPFEITITPKIAGSATQLMRVYEGEQLELEVPIVLRAEL